MSWATDRGNLWNTAENAEVRSDARVAREYLVALPAELSPQSAHQPGHRIFPRAGRALSIRARHRDSCAARLSGQRSAQFPRASARNHARGHSHGIGRQNSPRMERYTPAAGRPRVGRRRVAAMCANSGRWPPILRLNKSTINARIDHRTLKAQGIDREPKPHIPHAAFEMERHGYHSVVAERIRAEYQARVEARLQRAAQEQPVAAPKSLADKTKEFALRWFRYWQAQEQAEPKSPEQPAKDSIQSGFGYRQGRGVPPKSREAQQNESAQRRDRYRQPHQEAPPRRPQDLAKESALRWAAKYGREAKSSRDIAMESAVRWKERYDKVDSKSSRDIAMESAMRWKELYGQGAQESPEATAKESAPGRRYQEARGREREQSDPAQPSAKRARGIEFDL